MANENLTRAKLERFVRIRNESGFSSNLQFGFDLREAGIDALPDAKETEPGVYEWQTPVGRLVETHGFMELVS